MHLAKMDAIKLNAKSPFINQCEGHTILENDSKL